MRQGLLPGIRELIWDAKKKKDIDALGLLTDKLIDTIETMDGVILVHERMAELAGLSSKSPQGKRIDLLVGKTVKTRGGFDVEIIAVRPELKQPIIGILKFEECPDELEQWYMDGSFVENSKVTLDLVLE